VELGSRAVPELIFVKIPCYVIREDAWRASHEIARNGAFYQVTLPPALCLDFQIRADASKLLYAGRDVKV
jgi:hypothetical protein